MAQTTCSRERREDGPLGVRTMGDIIWAKYAPNPSPKGHE